jgi:hypothetical protein
MATVPHPGQPAEDRQPDLARVHVRYLPAAQPFTKSYAETTSAEAVRVDAMAFFGVRDRQERDTYRYYLIFRGARVTNTSQTLEELAGEHPGDDELSFQLVEEITPGAA